ncbi:uncharacterized protein LOC115634365 [Scaptodrosophila lebanonensis]|uniref:Uncharacterized protein LOC115634365 n=1 Tax=Drosophila lebanonensis TaxID=7225 RepID=A0A6J2UKX9_DROLE|nr:uncharacterized protein LOC115634365 [Scaptodrosophila lebanonensis]
MRINTALFAKANAQPKYDNYNVKKYIPAKPLGVPADEPKKPSLTNNFFTNGRSSRGRFSLGRKMSLKSRINKSNQISAKATGQHHDGGAFTTNCLAMAEIKQILLDSRNRELKNYYRKMMADERSRAVQYLLNQCPCCGFQKPDRKHERDISKNIYCWGAEQMSRSERLPRRVAT